MNQQIHIGSVDFDALERKFISDGGFAPIPRSFARARKFHFLPSHVTVLALRGDIPMLVVPMTVCNLSGGKEAPFLLDNRWKAIATANGGILCHVPREKHRVFWEWAKEHKINVEYMQAGAVPKF